MLQNMLLGKPEEVKRTYIIEVRISNHSTYLKVLKALKKVQDQLYKAGMEIVTREELDVVQKP